MAEQLVMQKTLQAAQMIEKKIDAEIEHMNSLDEDGLERLRAKRMQELKQQAQRKEVWKQLGHGKYEEIGDEKQWFQECKDNERVVCHFSRSTTENCQVVDKHLDILARKHFETRFIKINAEKCAFLVERLNIYMMPTIVCTQNNHTADVIEGFDSLGGRADFSTLAMEKRLAKKGIIDFDEAAEAHQAKMEAMRKSEQPTTVLRKGYHNPQDELSDSEFD